MDWICVSDQLPPAWLDVLVIVKPNRHEICFRTDNSWRKTGYGPFDGVVTHWMFLPEFKPIG